MLLIRLLALAVVFGVFVGPDATADAKPPNVVHVLIDDMGYSDLGCYGNHEAKTPNIDRLASEGMRFTNFYTAFPICSPSRTAWTTGQYPSKFRIHSYLAKRSENTERGMPQWLNSDVWTLADGLKAKGYATGHFGKWHMGGQRDVAEAPLITEYGFDASLTNFEGLGDRVLPLLNAFDGLPAKRYSLGSEDLGHGNITWLDRDQVTGAFVKRTVAFIKEAQKQQKPFYVNVWPDDVHSPFFPAEAKSKLKLKRKRYLAVEEDMDRQFGELFDLIRNDQELRNNTLVIVTSDNGPEPGAGSCEPYRGHKGRILEGGIREPLIVWGPGLIAPSKAGDTNSESWLTTLDVFRSLVTLTGVTPPPTVALDGDDLSKTLLGQEAKSRVTPAIWVRPPDRPGPVEDPWHDLAIRQGDWKLLCMQDGSATELYDLATDPTESRNLADRKSQIVGQLKPLVLDWFAKTYKGEYPPRPKP